MLNPNSTEADKQLQQGLLEGEKLLWTGRAGTGVKFVLRDILLIPAGIIFFSVALFWESLVLIGLPFFYKIGFSLVGVPFIVLGFYLLIGRFWLDMKRRSKTFYGITPKRLIIKLIRHRTVVEVFNIETLSSMEIEERPDGSGTIKLDADPPRYSAWKTGYTPRKIVWAIEYVQDIRSVYNLIVQQQEIINKAALADHLKNIALTNA
jgi:hypothetical protein